MANVPKYLIVHHTGGTDADPKADTSHHTAEMINEWHKQLWNFKSSLGWYVGYHYIIEKDGLVQQCRAHADTGAHTVGMNSSSIGICLTGNFDYYDPTPEQVTALTALLTKIAKQYSIPKQNIVPHRKYTKKTCYGKRLADDWAANLLPTAPSTCTLAQFTIGELTAEVLRRAMANKLPR